MWPASARSARLPDHRAPATSMIRNPHVRARVAVSRPREREAAVDRCESPSIERIVAGSCYVTLYKRLARSGAVRRRPARARHKASGVADLRRQADAGCEHLAEQLAVGALILPPSLEDAPAAVADHPQEPLGAF